MVNSITGKVYLGPSLTCVISLHMAKMIVMHLNNLDTSTIGDFDMRSVREGDQGMMDAIGAG